MLAFHKEMEVELSKIKGFLDELHSDMRAKEMEFIKENSFSKQSIKHLFLSFEELIEILKKHIVFRQKFYHQTKNNCG